MPPKSNAKFGNQDDKLNDAKEKVDAVKKVMQHNVQQALDNTAKIDDIELGSQQLLDGAKTFERDSRKLKWKMCKDHWKVIILSVLGVGILITIVALISKNS